MTITAANVAEGVQTRIDFAGFGEVRSTIETKAHGDHTDVVWMAQGDLGSNPYWKLMFKLMVALSDDAAKEYDEGLANLKARAEARARGEKPGKATDGKATDGTPVDASAKKK
jgi:hypothetical protein